MKDNRKVLGLLVSVLILATQVKGQNLVPNPSFEEFSELPNAHSQISRCTHWFETSKSVDYFHRRGKSYAKLPSQRVGQAYPYHGEAVAGFIAGSTEGISNSEILTVQLTESLAIGQRYRVSFLISNGRDPDSAAWHLNSFDLGCDGIGVYFSRDVSNFRSRFMNGEKLDAITITEILWSTEWHRVTFFFTALDSFDHLSIGNFNSIGTTRFEIFRPTGNNRFAYYFVDSVSVIKAEDIAIEGDRVICAGDSVLLRAVNTPNPTWFVMDNKKRIISRDSQLWIKPKGDTTISLKYWEQQVDHTIKVRPVTPTQLKETYFMCEDKDSIVLLDAGNGFNSYRWLASGETSQAMGVDKLGKYFVEIEDRFGCISLDSCQVLSDCVVPTTLFLPSVFSPNQDGYNDSFGVLGENVIEFHLRIFNRWGDCMYETQSPNHAWDGKFKGVNCPVGVYFVTCNFTKIDENGTLGFSQYSGSITLLR